MKKQPSESRVSLALQADKPVLSREKPCTRILEVSITPPEKNVEKVRAPLNLSLVLDRSGSMSGEKLQFVKQAAAHVIDLLEEKDMASVVIYDDQVETIVPPGNLTAEYKTQAKRHIQEVRSGGSTFLSGGWLKGCEHVAAISSKDSISRALLLTDGLANVGMKDIDELSTHARQLYLRGVSTSCFGVGLGYDEHLLESMANSGGGNFHFLETLNAIPLVFEREFEELVSISLRDTEVSIKLPAGVKAEVSAGWHSEFNKNRYSISLGSLYSGRTLKVYVTLHFEKTAEESEISIPVTVRGKGEGEYLCEAVQLISFRTVSAKKEESTAPDPTLMERFSLVDMADRANEALKRERTGDRAGASVYIRDSLMQHQASMPSSMKSKFEFMADEMKNGMGEESRKRHHREEYENKRGRQVYRDYGLDLVNGHLITRIENQVALIDTGIPISLGEAPEFYFLNEVHTLSPSYMGVTLDYLRKMVGAPIDILLGTDILKKYFVTIALPEQRISFSPEPLFRPIERVPITNFMGAPIAGFIVEGLERQMFVDTGAKLSYVDKTIAADFSPIGKEQDFYPGLGEFETPVFQVPFQLGREKFTLRCGVLPELLETTLLVTGKHGIVGSEFYEKFTVCLAFPENTIYLRAY